MPHGGTPDFGGYVVSTSSGARVEGGLLRRIISLIGGGAKASSYFLFGPEYNFPYVKLLGGFLCEVTGSLIAGMLFATVTVATVTPRVRIWNASCKKSMRPTI